MNQYDLLTRYWSDHARPPPSPMTERDRYRHYVLCDPVQPTAPPTSFDKQGKALPAGYRKKVKDKRGQ